MNSMKEKMVSPLATNSSSKGNVIKDENIFTEIVKQQIIDSFYREFGKPENIIKEKLNLYLGKETPAGAYQPPWNDGGWQRGRFTVFVSHEEDGLQKQTIGGSWFFKTDAKTLKVSSGTSQREWLDINLFDGE